MKQSLRIPKKRRRQNKTDYKSRFSLLQSGAVRLVIRKTNKFIIVQAIESKEAQDKILFGVTSKNLVENGWSDKYAGSLKSVPAAYLTGMLMAKQLDKKQKYIVDTGMARNVHGSRIYAAVKGLIDGGANINADKKAFPSEDRLKGEHLDEKLKEIIAKVKEKIQ